MLGLGISRLVPILDILDILVTMGGAKRLK
jgi:hypothetical protein